MEQIQLEVQVRQESGTGVVSRLRLEGFIPGVVYGGEEKPLAVKVLRKDFDRIMRQHGGESFLFNVDLVDNGKKAKSFVALLKEVQHHPVSDTADHLDFQRVSMDKEISVRIPVILKGEAIGLKKPGATLEHMLREIEVICLPTIIPNHIEVDVSHLDTHDSVHVKDLALPQGVRTKADPSSSVVSVVFATREEVATDAATGEAAAQPELEVIKEKPKDEKAAEGAAGAKPGAGAAAAKPAAAGKGEAKK